MRPTALFVSLFGFYVVLSGQITNAFLMIVGAGCCLVVTLLSVHMGICDGEGMPVRYWGRTFRYTPWLMWQILLANFDVARRVWSPSLPIDPCMVEVPHRLVTGYGIATFANSITLTPGTVTVEAGDGLFLVHALTKEAGDDVTTGDMHDRVRHIEGEDPPDEDKRRERPLPTNAGRSLTDGEVDA